MSNEDVVGGVVVQREGGKRTQSSADTIETTKEKLRQDNTTLQANYSYNAPSETTGEAQERRGPL